MSDEKFYCSFCAKESAAVKVLVAGPTAFICDQCVLLCLDILIKRPRPSNVEDFPAVSSDGGDA